MTQDKQGTPVAVTRNEAEHRFEISYPDTGELGGFAQYLDHGGERIFYHTEVPEKFGGRGLASILIGEALNATTAEGTGIVAVCPFVKGYLEKKGHQGQHRPGTTSDLKVLEEKLGGL